MAHGLSAVPAGVTLRPLSPNDRDFLRRLYASTREEELAPVPWTDDEKAMFLEQQFEAQSEAYSAYPDADFRVILVDDAPAGRLYVARWRDEIRIMDIALLPEFRGRGIGTRLLRDLLDEGTRTGKRVSIHVEHANPALRLYERLGFARGHDKGLYVLMEAWPERNREERQAKTAS